MPAAGLPRLAAGAVVGCALALALLQPAWLPPGTVGAAALGLAAIGLWATAAVPEHLTSLGFFLLAVVLGVASPATVFAGFHSPALWLVFGGLVIGAAVQHTGLGERIAGGVAGRLPGRYGAVVAGVVAIGLIMSFLIPSAMARVVLIAPIAAALAQRFGFSPGRPGRTGIVVAAVFGANIPGFGILPANVPTVVLLGTADGFYGSHFSYGSYLALHFPLLGLGKAAAIVALTLALFPDHCPAAGPGRRPPAPWTQAERRLVAVVTAALSLWATDFLHGVSPAWVALAGALVCLAPSSGVLPERAVSRSVNYESVLFVAGILGLGSLLADSGLGDALARSLVQWLPLDPQRPPGNFFALALAAAVVAPLTTAIGVPAVLTPAADALARAAGMELETVLMTQVIGLSTMLFPYQVAPLVVGVKAGGESLASATRLTLALAAVTGLVLLPLDYLWWRWLGWI